MKRRFIKRVKRKKNMPPLSELPGEMKRRKLIRALTRLGFEIDKSGGNGSHYKITWPKTQKSLTIQSDLRKDVLKYVIAEIERYTNNAVNWEDIKKEL